MLPGTDPVTKSPFAATEIELEAIAGFQETMRKLKSKRPVKEEESEDVPHGGAQPKNKSKK